MRNIVRVSLTGLFLGANLTAAFAQATPEQMEMAYNAARNQLGVLTYCKDKGYTDGAAIEIQNKLLGMIPLRPTPPRLKLRKKPASRARFPPWVWNRILPPARRRRMFPKKSCARPWLTP